MSRLGPERLEELYTGTLALVAEHGYERITMDQIAETTRSSKATLYRQWGSKAALVVDAVRSISVVPDQPADTGTVRGDLLAMVANRSRGIIDQADLIGAILHAVKADVELRAAVRDQIVSILRERVDIVLQRAVARGEVDADRPGVAFADLVLMSPFVLRLVVDDEPVDDQYLTDYIDAVVLPTLGITT